MPYMNATDIARRIQVLESKIDSATLSRRSLSKAERIAQDAKVTGWCNELGQLLAVRRAA